jgi:hypothetical protein
MPPVVNIAWVFAATSEVVMETNVLDEQLKAIAKFFDKTIYENKE